MRLKVMSPCAAVSAAAPHAIKTFENAETPMRVINYDSDANPMFDSPDSLIEPTLANVVGSRSAVALGYKLMGDLTFSEAYRNREQSINPVLLRFCQRENTHEFDDMNT